MLTLLTATGCRPRAWAICQSLMMAQTYTGPARWVVVDDGHEMQPLAFEREGWVVEIIRPAHRWRQGMNTQALNLLAGLDVIGKDDRVVIIEDDDYYAPEWLETVAGWLDSADLVGEGQARYYNVATGRYKQMSNRRHASLCSTAMKGAALSLFRRCCIPNVQFIDLNLWQTFTGTKAIYDTALTVGTKGLPGRCGIGSGHANDFGMSDRNGAVLQEWLGNAAPVYSGFRTRDNVRN